MGRRSLSEPRKRINLYIEEALLTRFALLHFDPTRGTFEYGKLSEVVNALLRKDLDEIDMARQATNLNPASYDEQHKFTPINERLGLPVKGTENG